MASNEISFLVIEDASNYETVQLFFFYPWAKFML